MKKSLTIISRGAVFLMGSAVLVVCGILIPEIAREEEVRHPGDPMINVFLIGAWVLATPIFIALYQTTKLLGYIDQKNAFSLKSIHALQIIKFCTIIFGAMIIMCAIILATLAKNADPTEDVAPVGTISFIFTFVSIVIAAFVAVLQRLLKDAIKIKSENDLTV